MSISQSLTTQKTANGANEINQTNEINPSNEAALSNGIDGANETKTTKNEASTSADVRAGADAPGAPRRTIRVASPVFDSFRVRAIAGMFDAPIEQKTEKTITFEPPPAPDDDWRVGLIVGPSGSGKTTVANELYPTSIYRGADWAPDRATIDNFADRPTKEIVRMLTTVGFSSPPSWVQPFSTLSNGEKFRCELARALLDSESEIVVFDEFTSVVDRTVAKTGAAALSSGIRNGFIRKKFIALSCHYDVVDWLEPDWVLDAATGRTTRRRLRRPRIELEIVASDKKSWPVFAKFHYLSASLSPSAQCYLAFWDETPVAFCATLPTMGVKKRRRVTRLVTLPDFQGIGIGTAFLEALGDYHRERGLRFGITSSHPSVVRHCERSTAWKTISVLKTGRGGTQFGKKYAGSAGRAVVSFEYLGARFPAFNAQRYPTDRYRVDT